jgi:hypothetical protein
VEELIPNLYVKMDATLQSLELMAWNGVAKYILVNVEQIREELRGFDSGLKDMTNILGSHVIDCLNKLHLLGNDLVDLSLFLKGFVDWKVEMRNMLEEAFIDQENKKLVVDAVSKDHLVPIYEKLDELEI